MHRTKTVNANIHIKYFSWYGQLAHIKLANGVEVKYAYDAMGRCTGIKTDSFTQDIQKKDLMLGGNLRVLNTQIKPDRFDY